MAWGLVGSGPLQGCEQRGQLVGALKGLSRGPETLAFPVCSWAQGRERDLFSATLQGLQRNQPFWLNPLSYPICPDWWNHLVCARSRSVFARIAASCLPPPQLVVLGYGDTKQTKPGILSFLGSCF